MTKVKIKTIAAYKGHSVKPTGVVEVTLGFKYDELTNYIQAIQMLNEDVEMKVRLGTETKRLGEWRVNNMQIDHDGNAVIRFRSTIQAIDGSILNDLADYDNKEIIPLMLSAEIEDDGEDEEDAE
jgi:hypothetical protein